MLCTVTDCSVDLLKKGKQINRAVIYGAALNYSNKKCKLPKMTLDFINNSMSIIMFGNELTISEVLNLLVSLLH